jgi:Protein of unknown function (DUF2934)
VNDFSEAELHERIEKLAYEYWERRGRPLGSPEIDWFEAKKALVRPSRDSETGFSLFDLQLEPNEGDITDEGNLCMEIGILGRTVQSDYRPTGPLGFGEAFWQKRQQTCSLCLARCSPLLTRLGEARSFCL